MKIYTVEQAAEQLSVSAYTLREWLKQGRIKGSKLGRLWRITEEHLQDFVKRHESAQTRNGLL